MPTLDRRPDEWREAVRRLEGAGYASVAVSDHLTRGWAMDPLVAMMAASAATDRLRVLSLVLSNDYRHPALLHKAIATIDLLSSGRVELGLGAGWLAEDYDALGLPAEAAGVRIDRLAESVRLLKELFATDVPFDFEGARYRGRGLEGRPRTPQQPHPPILIGGGGRRILALAAREANIIGVNATLAAGAGRASGVAGLTAPVVEQKVRWVREAAIAAGRRPDDLELQVSVLELHVVDSEADRKRVLDALAESTGLDVPALEESPAVLAGSIDACADTLSDRRARFGFSYIKLGPDAAAAAPIVARLAGT